MFIENLDLVREQLKDGESKRPVDPDFQLESFWTKLGGISKVIAHEATKMTISFSQPPFPTSQDLEILQAGMEKAVLALVSIFYSLPLHFGACLHKQVKQAVISIVDEVHTLASTVTNLPKLEAPLNLHTTGGVWAACDKITSLPIDNKIAVLEKTKENFGLVEDALKEIESRLKNEGDDCFDFGDMDDEAEDEWTNEDRALIEPCLALVKAIRGFLKKSASSLSANGECDATDFVSQLDEFVPHVERLSAEVDEFISGLYPPIDSKNEVQMNAASLAALLKESLEYFRSTHFCGESDQHWIEFLFKAIDHNIGRLNGLV